MHPALRITLVVVFLACSVIFHVWGNDWEAVVTSIMALVVYWPFMAPTPIEVYKHDQEQR